MSAPALELRDVRLARGRGFRLQVDELALAAGEALGVVGPNGSGKSTLVRVLALLDAPDAGTVRFAGEEAGATGAAAVARRRRMGVAFHEPLLLRGSALDNAALPLRLRGVARPEAGRRARAWLDRLGAGGLADRDARALSSGEAQRVSVARALVAEPEVVILDEPFSALDPADRGPLQREVVAGARARGAAVVLVTHEREVAAALADRLVLLDAGRVVEQGPPAAVLGRPRSEAGARWAGFENVLPAEAVAAGEHGAVRVELPGGAALDGISGPAGAVCVCLRAESITLWSGEDAPPGEAGSLRNVVPGRVVSLVRAGPTARAVVTAGRGPDAPRVEVLLSTLSADRLGLEADEPAWLGVKAAAVHLVPRGFPPSS